MLKQNYKKYAASITIWVVLQSRVPFGVLVNYTGAVLHWGPKRGPNLENYLYVTKNTTNKVQLLRRRVSRHFVGVKLVSFGTQNPKP